MKTTANVLLLIALLSLQACTPFAKFSYISQRDDSSVVINSETFKSYNFIPLTTDTTAKTIVATGVPAGRIWDFGLENKNLDLTCTPATPIEPAVYHISNSTLHVDIGPRDTDGSLLFNCDIKNSPFTFEIKYVASRLQIISSNIFNTKYYLTNTDAPQVSKNGVKVVFSSVGQIYMKDLYTGDLRLISSSDGTVTNQGNGISSNPSISGDGSKVVFTSTSTNLISGATGTQIYLKNLLTNNLSLVTSIDSLPANQGNAASGKAHISADGTQIVFESAATNLLATATAGTQVFVKKLNTNTISLASSSDGTPANQGNGPSTLAKISENGNFIVFTSNATNLVSPVSSGTQVFLKNTVSGAIRIVSTIDGSASVLGNAASTEASISSDGTKVVFKSSATNLLSTATSGAQIFLKNLNTNAVTLISAINGDPLQQGNADSEQPKISADGNFVIFKSLATNLLATATVGTQVFQKSLTSGTLSLVSSKDATVPNQANAVADLPDISNNGEVIVFRSEASNLQADALGKLIYFKKTNQLSAIAAENVSAYQSGNADIIAPQISEDNKTVLFHSELPNLLPGIQNSFWQVFVKDLTTGRLTLVSSQDGTPATAGNGYSYAAKMSRDGTKVIFLSNATNLVPGVTNDINYQIYHKDLETGVITLVSSYDGDGSHMGNSQSYVSAISDDGNRVAFRSTATNLINGVTLSGYQTYVKDINTNTMKLISFATSGINDPTNQGYSSTLDIDISGDGTEVVFDTNATNLWPGSGNYQVYVRNVDSNLLYVVSSTNKFSGAARGNNNSYRPRISRDGKKVIFYSYATNFLGGCGGAGKVQVYIKNLDTDAFTMGSTTDGTCAGKANNHSFNATMSDDTNIIAFQSYSTNLIPGVVLPPGSSHTYVRNIATNEIKMLNSLNGVAAQQGNQSSFYPVVSPDGKFTLFSSMATNLFSNVEKYQIYLFKVD